MGKIRVRKLFLGVTGSETGNEPELTDLKLNTSDTTDLKL